MRQLIIFLFLIKFNFSFSQKVKEEEIFTAVEKQAEYPGGMAAFGKFLQKNFSISKDSCQTKIYVQFVVEKDGSPNNVRFLTKDTYQSTKDLLTKLILKVKWTPGYQGGKPVRSRFTIPMNNHCYGYE
jgi:periplasmic protein TonB